MDGGDTYQIISLPGSYAMTRQVKISQEATDRPGDDLSVFMIAQGVDI
jgi:hypothetical protein